MGRVAIDDFESILAEVRNVPEEPENLKNQKNQRNLKNLIEQRAEKNRRYADTPSLKAFLENTVEQDRTPDHETWRSPAWFLARECKGRSELQMLSGPQAWKKIRPLLKKIENAHSQGISDEEFGMDFMACWQKIKILPGLDVLENALRRSASIGLGLLVDRGLLYSRFIALAASLQQLCGDSPIMLPTRRIGPLLGVTHITASRLIRFAIEDELIRRTETHNYAKHRAARYRFAIERWPHLSLTGED